jgi:hypothetical protein
MVRAAQAGLMPKAFWEVTPRELSCYLHGRAEAHRDEWRRALWQAWHGEAFQRTKRLPELKQIMAKLDHARGELTVEELYKKIQFAQQALTFMAETKAPRGIRHG